MAFIYEKYNYLKESLFNNEAVRGISNVMDFTYLKLLRLFLIVINGWPGKENGEIWPKHMNVISYGYLIFFVMYTTSLVTYLIKHAAVINAFDFGTSCVYLLLVSVYVTRVFLTLTTKYKNTISLFITKFHLFHFKDVSAYALKIHKKVHRILHPITLFTLFQIFCGNFVFTAMTVVNNYQAGNFEHIHLVNSTYEQAVHLTTPFDTESNLYGYITLCLLIWVMGQFDVIFYYIIDFLLFLMIVHVWGHLKILLHDLETFPLPANKTLLRINDNQTVNVDMYNADELKQVHEKLKECINHHRLIMKFTKNMSEAFGVMLVQYMIFYLTIGCILLFVSSIMDKPQIMRLAQLVFGVFQQLIILSCMFELVGSTSAKLSDAVYAVPWECMDTKNRKTVWIFLMNVQEPIRIKAHGLIDIGANTMISILKTSFSYYTFLCTLQFNDESN